MLKDTKSLGNNKAPACESRGFVHKKRGVHFDTPPLCLKKGGVHFDTPPLCLKKGGVHFDTPPLSLFYIHQYKILY